MPGTPLVPDAPPAAVGPLRNPPFTPRGPRDGIFYLVFGEESTNTLHQKASKAKSVPSLFSLSLSCDALLYGQIYASQLNITGPMVLTQGALPMDRYPIAVDYLNELCNGTPIPQDLYAPGRQSNYTTNVSQADLEPLVVFRDANGRTGVPLVAVLESRNRMILRSTVGNAGDLVNFQGRKTTKIYIIVSHEALSSSNFAE